MLLLNGQPVPVTIFPDKTSQVWKLPESTFDLKKQNVFWQFENESELFHLAQLQDLLREKIWGVQTTLTMKYLPYGRQDKLIANDATFALKTFLRIINSLDFHKIVIFDPHNFDACRFHCAFEAKYPEKLVEQVAKEMSEQNGHGTIFCYPDKGALTKYTKVYEQSYRPHIYGEKVRDQATGNILSYKVVGGCVNQNVLIVDDICDGGMTFKLLAKDLLAAGAKSVVLFVTHGLFSKGIQTLKDSGISRIFCQDGECFEEPGAHWWTKKL